MSKQQYEVKLLGHAGESRNRAGLYFERGVATTVELDADQLAAIEADSYFSVKPVGEASNDQGSGEPSLMEQKRPALDKMATDLGLDPKEYKNKETLVPAIEEAQKAKIEADQNGGTGNDDETEDVVLTDLSDEELLVIAEELKVEVSTEGTPEEQRTALIAGIEAAQAKTEE